MQAGRRSGFIDPSRKVERPCELDFLVSIVFHTFSGLWGGRVTARLPVNDSNSYSCLSLIALPARRRPVVDSNLLGGQASACFFFSCCRACFGPQVPDMAPAC